MKKLSMNIIPGIKVKILDRKILIDAGYEDNNDEKDFLNLLSGKIVTIDQVFEDDGIYTCKEYPDLVIYKVFIEKIIFNSINPSNDNIGNIIGLSKETVRRAFTSAFVKLEEISKSKSFEEFYYE